MEVENKKDDHLRESSSSLLAKDYVWRGKQRRGVWDDEQNKGWSPLVLVKSRDQWLEEIAKECEGDGKYSTGKLDKRTNKARSTEGRSFKIVDFIKQYDKEQFALIIRPSRWIRNSRHYSCWGWVVRQEHLEEVDVYANDNVFENKNAVANDNGQRVTNNENLQSEEYITTLLRPTGKLGKRVLTPEGIWMRNVGFLIAAIVGTWYAYKNHKIPWLQS